jgi:hypothetical protein
MKDSNNYNSESIDFSKLGKVLSDDFVPDLLKGATDAGKLILIFSQHRFYRNLVLELAYVSFTNAGKVKNPLRLIDATDLLWKTNDQTELKFFSGVAKFKNNYNEGKSESDVEALKAVAVNPLKLPVFIHDDKVSPTINATSLVSVQLEVLAIDLTLTVNKRLEYYELVGKLFLGNQDYSITNIKLKYNYFIQIKDRLYLIAI